MFINDLVKCKDDQHLGTLDAMPMAVLKCQEVLKKAVDLRSSRGGTHIRVFLEKTRKFFVCNLIN